jgi:penicillin-binding protein 2
MRQLENRSYVIVGLFLFFAIVYVVRLFQVQIFSEEFLERAQRVAVEKVIEYPIRGNIYDRNGMPLVENEVAYDILVTPNKLKIDTAKFCEVLEITKEEFLERMEKAKNYSWRKASVFESMIKAEEFGKIRERLYQFKGVSVKNRTVRKYPYIAAAQVLGYISKVGKRTLSRDEFYVETDYVGASGIESYYEKSLRGEKGYSYFLRDINGNHIDKYEGGALDELPVPGKDIYLSLDGQLQKYAESLMIGKRGAIVAIEPTTGEVLTMVSAPTYDPNLLVGRKYGKNYKRLEQDSNKVFYQRAIKSTQPPGSIVKPMQAAISLQLETANINTAFHCNKNLVGCHDHPSPLNLPQSIQNSCNPYYYNLVKNIFLQGKSDGNYAQLRMGMNEWEDVVRSFGFGSTLGIDLYGEREGNVPDVREYDQIYGKNRWNFSTVYSIAIGQGEFSVTPLQMANLAAALANKGHYYQPHIAKKIGDSLLSFQDSSYYHKTLIEPNKFDIVHDGMQWVIEEPWGTARRARIDSLHYCGKTGTSQNPHGEDHSVFICFAPRENPKIAIAVFVENAGGGGSMAAPIAGLLVEQYLRGKITRPQMEEYVLSKSFY